MNTLEERKVNPIEEMARIARNFLNLDTRGFIESYSSTKENRLIFDSDWCRIKLFWDGWDYLTGNTIGIQYGRLHAPNEKMRMLWNGEECHCWHDFEHALHFLDGRTSEEAIKIINYHTIISPFYVEEFRQKFRGRQPEWLAHMHVAIWNYYGNRFFELFDLRKPHLWKQYQQFLKEFYDIKGRSKIIKPPLDNVC